ncbi:MAG: hypothetical protein OHK0013_25190 [Sandaracinaceae bacterium]
MPIHVDDTRHPLVVVTFEGDVTDAEFVRYLAEMESRVLVRRRLSATVFDATKAGATSARQRRMQAEWMEKNEEALARYSAGSAFVITSPLVRGTLTAILWLKPLPVPHVVVGTFAEAEQWCRDRLRARGVEAA